MQHLRLFRPKHYVIRQAGTVLKVFPNDEDAQAECMRMNGEGQYEVADLDAATGDMETYALALIQAEDAGFALMRAWEEARDAALGALLAGSHMLFEEHPGLQSFSWLQPLESSRHPWGDHLDENCELKVDCKTRDIDGLDGGKPESGGGPELEAETQLHVMGFLHFFAIGDMWALFGVDVRVTVYRDGRVEVEEV